ncbi:hypothetical protein A9K75_06740 [Campylobacter fetus subsp. testudinum]|uniref:conjugal transfer protein TraG N-terminal domain-containing protein n=1 Tax=Campylobacter fetus TaxID=196 RepID=UPI000818C446|nr:conjugal transfer protein TraG N-terminal domain-containing protein [Campylobacter fetus]OCR99562.1 hypothetical protein A9K75_06740 [Campylobacter fetus subsp. testudinum]
MIRKIFLLLFLVVSPIFAVDNSDVIWVWGDGELLAKMISTMYAVLNEPFFVKYIGNTAAIIASIAIIIKVTKTKGDGGAYAIEFVFYIALTIFAWKGFLEVEQKDIDRVYILNINEAAGGTWAKCTPVNGDDNCYMPWATKWVITAATNFERGMLAILEKASIATNAQTYSFKTMGYGYSFDLYDSAERQLPPSWATKTYNAFWDNCLIYEINSGTRTLDDIVRSKDLSVDILTPTSARLTTIYTKNKPKGYLSSCSDVDLNHLTGNETCQTIASNTPNSANKDKDQLCVGYQNFAQLMLNTAKDADSIIKQQIMVKMTNRAIRSSMIVAGLDPNAMAGGLVTADREQRTKWASIGLMAKEWLPTIRDIMQAFIPFFAVVGAFLAIGVGSLKPLGLFVGFLATLTMWSVCLELVNIATYHYLSKFMPNMFEFDIGKDGMRTTLLTGNYVSEQFQKASAFLGYMVIATYGIAQGIVVMSYGKVAGAVNGAIGGLGLSSFAARSVAQGKIETPMSNVGPDGVTNWNALRSDKEVINSYGSYTTEGMSKTGFKYETKQMNRNTSTTVSDTNSNSITYDQHGRVQNVNSNVFDAKELDAITKSMENGKQIAAERMQTANNNLTQARQNLETIADTLSNSDMHTDTTGTTKQSTDQSITTDKTSTRTTNSIESRNLSGSTTSSSASAGYTVGGILSKVSGLEVKLQTQIEGHHSKEEIEATRKELSKTREEAKSSINALVKSTSEQDTKTRALLQQASNALVNTELASNSYQESFAIKENFSKLEKEAETKGISVGQNALIEVGQDYVDRFGAKKGSEMFLLDMQNSDKMSEMLSGFVKQQKGSLSEKVDSEIYQTGQEIKNQEITLGGFENNPTNKNSLTDNVIPHNQDVVNNNPNGNPKDSLDNMKEWIKKQDPNDVKLENNNIKGAFGELGNRALDEIWRK